MEKINLTGVSGWTDKKSCWKRCRASRWNKNNDQEGCTLWEPLGTGTLTWLVSLVAQVCKLLFFSLLDYILVNTKKPESSFLELSDFFTGDTYRASSNTFWATFPVPLVTQPFLYDVKVWRNDRSSSLCYRWLRWEVVLIEVFTNCFAIQTSKRWNFWNWVSLLAQISDIIDLGHS